MVKKILLTILLVVVVLVVGFAVVVALQPSEYRVERMAKIAAPPATVFAQINDFRKWEAWSPWAKRDPNATATFEGPDSGKGAKFHWSGNEEVGEGTMTILESKPDELIRMKLDFLKPQEGTCTTEFIFKAEGDQTVVTWTMTGENDFMGRAVCLFMDLDSMIGTDFEEALANIKAVAEAEK
jgi:uncharacterized protein YndB with AHSA1/START domain